MTSGIASATIDAATTFMGETSTLVLMVVGLSLTFIIAGWAIAKFRRKGGKRTRKARRKK